MILTVFRSRLDPAHAVAYRATAAHMRALAEAMPGFISYKTFTAEDGERVSIIEFESEEALHAWREHPEHRKAQALGRESFYSEFQVQVFEIVREHGASGSG